MSDVHSTGALRNCRDDGRCQYAIDHGAEGLGHCSPKCVMPRDQVGALRQQPEAVDHDRELLELAALAAGIALVPYTWFKGTGWDHDGFTVAGEGPDEWNPLEDDGDALRLAVKRGVHITNSETDAWATTQAVTAIEPLGTDPYAATRRAIVRAAAAIGSELRKTASGCSHTARSDDQEPTANSGSSHG